MSAALPLGDYGSDEDSSEGQAQSPDPQGTTRELYPDEDPAFDGGEPSPGSGDDEEDGEEAYPDTDAQFQRSVARSEEEEDDEEEEAYPDTDAQFGAAAVVEDDDEAYPDTDAQFEARAVATETALATEHKESDGTEMKPDAAPPLTAPVQSQLAAVPPVPCGWVPPAWAQPSQVLVNAALEEWAGGSLARIIPIAGRASIVIGRHGGMSDIVLADASVSRAHAAIVFSAEAAFVQDLGSAAGTFLDRNGKSVAPVARLGELVPKAPVQLQEGDTLRMGDSTHAFRVTGISTALPERFTPPVWAALPKARVQLEVIDASKPPNPYLAHLADGSAAGAELLPIYTKKCWIIGRSAQLADIVVRHESVSRQHCAIVHDEDATYVLDCGSATGTFLNNEDVGQQPRRVADGQMLSLGSATMTYTFRLGARGREGGRAKGEATAGGGAKKQRTREA